MNTKRKIFLTDYESSATVGCHDKLWYSVLSTVDRIESETHKKREVNSLAYKDIFSEETADTIDVLFIVSNVWSVVYSIYSANTF